MALTHSQTVLSPVSATPVPFENETDLHELFLANGWTDTLPIVLPTEERVAAMLAGTSHRPAEVVGQLRPSPAHDAHKFTVENVAVNAVMAGAEPAYLPVILALAASGVSARDGDPSSVATMVVVNGPVRLELEMNAGIGAMGPYNQANSTIGRAYGLLSQNLQGGSVPSTTYFGSQGNNYAFSSITVAENEERSPWAPFHVEQGFAPSASSVSIFSGCRHNTFTLGLREAHWRTHVRRMLLGMNAREHPLFVLDPLAARQFAERGGFDTKARLADWVYETAERVFPRDSIHVVVVGGETNAYWRMFGASYEQTVLVDSWR
jgi:hypothetical protein